MVSARPEIVEAGGSGMGEPLRFAKLKGGPRTGHAVGQAAAVVCRLWVRYGCCHRRGMGRQQLKQVQSIRATKNRVPSRATRVTRATLKTDRTGRARSPAL